jgi:hypothetical protein
MLVALEVNNARNSRAAATLGMEAPRLTGGIQCVVADLARSPSMPTI